MAFRDAQALAQALLESQTQGHLLWNYLIQAVGLACSGQVVLVIRPDIHGREQIFRLHLAKMRLDKPLEHFSERLAALTPGFAGAEIANICNEAALIAARTDKDAIGMADFESAVDRVIGGLEKKNKV